MEDHVPTYAADGAEHFPAAIFDDMEGILAALTHLPAEQAGIRIHGVEALRRFLAVDGSIGRVAAARLGSKPNHPLEKWSTY